MPSSGTFFFFFFIILLRSRYLHSFKKITRNFKKKSRYAWIRSTAAQCAASNFIKIYLIFYYYLLYNARFIVFILSRFRRIWVAQCFAKTLFTVVVWIISEKKLCKYVVIPVVYDQATYENPAIIRLNPKNV